MKTKGVYLFKAFKKYQVFSKFSIIVSSSNFYVLLLSATFPSSKTLVKKQNVAKKKRKAQPLSPKRSTRSQAGSFRCLNLVRLFIH